MVLRELKIEVDLLRLESDTVYNQDVLDVAGIKLADLSESAKQLRCSLEDKINKEEHQHRHTYIKTLEKRLSKVM